MATYFEEAIQCPECGHMTNELCEATSSSGQKVLMCEGCYEDSVEVVGDWEGEQHPF